MKPTHSLPRTPNLKCRSLQLIEVCTFARRRGIGIEVRYVDVHVHLVRYVVLFMFVFLIIVMLAVLHITILYVMCYLSDVLYVSCKGFCHQEYHFSFVKNVATNPEFRQFFVIRK